MSCCSGCESGWGDCGSGLAGLMGALVAAGSEVKVGFAYNLQTTSEEAFQGYGDANYIQEVLRGALLGSGAFQYATVIVTPPQYAGIQDGYILIQGTLYTDRPYVEEIADLAESLIREYLSAVIIRRRDPVHVLSVPANRPDASGTFDPTRTQNQPNQPGECNWDTMSFGDYIACQVGITSPIGGVGVGAVGALVGVGVLTLLAVAVLRR